MQLKPIASIQEPSYPTAHRGSPSWKRIAAVVAASAALWLPACGDDGSCPTRLGGEQPPVEDIRPPGTLQLPQSSPQRRPEDKPPAPQQPPVLPEDPPARLGGAIAPTAPPPQTPPERIAGQARAPEPPKHVGR